MDTVAAVEPAGPDSVSSVPSPDPTTELRPGLAGIWGVLTGESESSSGKERLLLLEVLLTERWAWSSPSSSSVYWEIVTDA